MSQNYKNAKPNHWSNDFKKNSCTKADTTKADTTKAVDHCNSDDHCCVCFGNDWVCRTNCKHYICLNCLIQIDKRCPICRTDISAKLPIFMRGLSKMYKDEKKSEDMNIYDNSQFPHLF